MKKQNIDHWTLQDLMWKFVKEVNSKMFQHIVIFVNLDLTEFFPFLIYDN